MEFNELLIKRRSIRDYAYKEVPNEILIEIIRDSAYAPSSGNEQPWKFIIVRDKLLMKKISDKAKSTLLKRIDKNPNDYAKKYEKMLNSEKYNIFYNAPALVFIIGDSSLKNNKINCTLAASYFMLSAASQGLGTCWINFATFIESQDMLEKLKIPDNHEIVAPIIVGYPNNIPKVPTRNDLEVFTIAKD